MTEPDLIIDVGAIVDGVASAGSMLALSVAGRGAGRPRLQQLSVMAIVESTGNFLG